MTSGRKGARVAAWSRSPGPRWGDSVPAGSGSDPSAPRSVWSAAMAPPDPSGPLTRFEEDWPADRQGELPVRAPGAGLAIRRIARASWIQARAAAGLSPSAPGLADVAPAAQGEGGGE